MQDENMVTPDNNQATEEIYTDQQESIQQKSDKKQILTLNNIISDGDWKTHQISVFGGFKYRF